MFEKNHYVPILKWKKGEQSAIEELDPDIKNGLTPLIEVPPIDWDYENEQPKRTIDEHLEGIINSFKRTLGTERMLYLDMLWIDPTERMVDGTHPLSHISDNARSQGVKIVPVTGTDRDPDYQREVKNALINDRLGLCFRLTENDFEDLNKNIDELLRYFNTSPDNIDLLIDYKYVDPKDRTRTYLFLNGLLNNIPDILAWRNLILTATAIPEDLSGLGTNQVTKIERSEWVIWNKIVSNSSNLRRIPLFGDYGIANPQPFEGDPRIIQPSANIRYTSGDSFIIFKGTNLKRNGYSQYHKLARKVVEHKEFKGENYSAGDKYIKEVSERLTNPGNLTSWREAGTSHHLTITVNDLASLTYSSVSF